MKFYVVVFMLSIISFSTSAQKQGEMRALVTKPTITFENGTCAQSCLVLEPNVPHFKLAQGEQ